MATGMRTKMGHGMFSARRFIGKDLYDVNGDHVGEVEDLILGVETACAKWAILSTGGVLGIGEKYRIVPIQALSIESDSGRLMLQFSSDRLANGPTYDRNNPPDWTDENWQRSVTSFYGLESAAGGGMGTEQSYKRGYQQGYQEGMQQQQQQMPMSGQQGSYYGQERRMSGQGAYTGQERRRMQHASMQQGGMQQGGMSTPIGGEQGSMQRSDTRH